MGKYHSKENYKDSISFVFDENNPLEQELFSLVTLNSNNNQDTTKVTLQTKTDSISKNEQIPKINSEIQDKTATTNKGQPNNLEVEKKKEVIQEDKKEEETEKETGYGIDYKSEDEEVENVNKNKDQGVQRNQAKEETNDVNDLNEIIVNKKYLESLKNLDEEQLTELYQKLSVEDSELKLILKENPLRNKNESSPSVIIPKYLIAFFNPFLYRVEEQFTKSDFILIKESLQKIIDFVKSHLQVYRSKVLKDYKLFLCKNENFVNEFIRTISFVKFDDIISETLITSKITTSVQELEQKSKWFEKDVIEELVPKFFKHFLYLILHLLVYNKDLEFTYFTEGEEFDEEKLNFFAEEEDNDGGFVQIFPLLTFMENNIHCGIAFQIDPDIEMELNEDREN
ncbi:myb-like hth transcriptional regulator family protein [Anaeramoeba flamelloides]|uniref:Myb-like hth transcriptional regulator family protein n=1 Tax=Anaeramoeba flamelloides TaxID=1746091 RepID=A0ABQ8XMB5_9EUKA|nr:myb-like hth transcriptional regulator family protein [Anaeramoeba flamelloides]